MDWSILDQTSLAFGAADGAGEDPQGEGEEDDEEGKEDEERSGDFGETVSFDQNLPDTVEAVSRWENRGDAAEFWTSVHF